MQADLSTRAQQPSFFDEVKGILALAVPVIVGLMSATLMGVIDTAMIAPLGTDALAATSLATSALIIIYSALFGLFSVVIVGMAQAYGSGNMIELADQRLNGMVLTAGTSLTAAVLMIAAFPAFTLLSPGEAILDLLFPYWVAMSAMAVPYALFGTLRGFYNVVNKPWIVVWFAMAGVAFNIPLNWLLIYAADLGLMGAGIASFLAKAASLLLTMLHLRRATSMARFNVKATFRARLGRDHLAQGWAVSLGSLGEGSAYAMTGLMMAGFGAVALAAQQVVHSVGAIMYIVPMGMTAAVAIRMGQAAGGGQTRRFRTVWWAANLIVVVWAAITFLPLLALRKDIATALSSNVEVIALTVPMFVNMALIQSADGLQSVAVGASRGLKDNRVPSLLSICIYCGAALPLAYMLGYALDWGPTGVLSGYAVGVLITALLLQFRFWMRTRP